MLDKLSASLEKPSCKAKKYLSFIMYWSPAIIITKEIYAGCQIETQRWIIFASTEF